MASPRLRAAAAFATATCRGGFSRLNAAAFAREAIGLLVAEREHEGVAANFGALDRILGDHAAIVFDLGFEFVARNDRPRDFENLRQLAGREPVIRAAFRHPGLEQ